MDKAAVAVFDRFLLYLKQVLELREFPVLQLSCFFQIIILFCFLDLFIDILNLLT